MSETYRDFIIERHHPMKNQPDTYIYFHKEYEEPGDGRIGFAKTAEECRAEIDEYWEERGDE